MTVSMQGYRGTRGLQRSHAIPELRIGSLSIQIGVLIVKDDSENRQNAVAREDRKEPFAPVLQHGRTKIVEANEILRRAGIH
jgi:hypothetical protein